MAIPGKLLKISKDNSGPNAAFPNYFARYNFDFVIPGAATTLWFKLDFGATSNLSCVRNFYLYLAIEGNDADIPVTLYRSGGVPNSELNAEYAVQIPGATAIIPAVGVGVKSPIDFNVTNFIADTIWMKIDVPLLTRGTGPIDLGYFITKDKS